MTTKFPGFEPYRTTKGLPMAHTANFQKYLRSLKWHLPKENVFGKVVTAWNRRFLKWWERNYIYQKSFD